MSIKQSIFERIVIESNDQSRTVDITSGCIQIDYYEDVFSPTITAKIRVVNTGNTVVGPDSKDNQAQSIYNGLPLRGGERVRMKIAGNRDGNPGLDFESDPKEYLYVSSITDVIAENNKESFTLNLVSREAITNETSRVYGKYSNAINESVDKILKDILKVNKVGTIEPTSNKYAFIGNLRKPFTVLTWLAAKGVPSVSGKETKDANAGFLFYQTKDGFQFRALDSLLNDKVNQPKEIFEYGEARETYDASDKRQNNDFAILNYYVEKNQNLIEKLRLGTYANYRMFFNPYEFKFDFSKFSKTNYDGKIQSLGSGDLKLPKVSDNSNETLGDIPTRIISAIYDVGTMEPGVSKASKEINANQMEYQSQALLRYNTLFTQSLNVMVPSNTNLKAGDLIECRFPKVSRSNAREYDMETTGLYMIKELCHHFDATRSYTSLKLIRDTFGIKK